MGLTHIDKKGDARMVDVGLKPATKRQATARAKVVMQPKTLELILSDGIKKGDVFATCRIAGIMAAKRTAEIIPLCHNVPITSVAVDITPVLPDTVLIEATVGCTFETGVEMEALHAASAAALTLYDMCKAVDRGMEIQSIVLLHKFGGRSGTFLRNAQPSIVSIELKEGTEVSLLDAKVRKQMKDLSGLCMNKFRADVITRGMDYGDLCVGDRFEIGEYAFTVTRKKDCYQDCPRLQTQEHCPLKNGCVFATVGKRAHGVKP